MGGGGAFLFVKTIEKVIQLCTVFEDMGIFHVFQLSFDGGRLYLPITDR